jgi:hypothetical protein
MNQPSPGALPAAFLDRLVAVMDPRGTPLGEEQLEAKLACSRWLALQRLREGIPLALAATRSHLDAETLVLLEAGLADQKLLSPISRRLLSNALAGTNRPYTLVANAVDVAIEQWGALNDTLLDRVWADLHGSARHSLAAAPLAEEQAERPQVAPAAAPSSPTAFLILQALEKARAPLHLVAITDAVALVQKWISDLEISLELEALLRYVSTLAGRQVFAAEDLRRKQAQHAADQRSSSADDQERLPPLSTT